MESLEELKPNSDGLVEEQHIVLKTSPSGEAKDQSLLLFSSKLSSNCSRRLPFLHLPEQIGFFKSHLWFSYNNNLISIPKP